MPSPRRQKQLLKSKRQVEPVNSTRSSSLFENAVPVTSKPLYRTKERPGEREEVKTVYFQTVSVEFPALVLGKGRPAVI